MNKKEYHLAYATDANYIMPLRVAAVSAAHYCPRDSDAWTTIWVLHEGVPVDEQSRLKTEVKRANPQVSVTFVDCEQAEKLPGQIEDERTHLSRAALFRLLIPKLLPASVKRVLYMDCDLVVLRDLEAIFNTDLGGYTLGAVLSWMFPTMGKRWKHEGNIEEVCEDPDTPYVNTGVMLIDIEAWRRQSGLSQSIIDAIDRYPNETRMKDQDGLNIIMQGRFQLLPGKWNAQTASFGSPNKDVRAQGKASAKAAGLVSPAEATVMHFTGGKPWARGFRDPFAPYWWRVAAFHNALSQSEVIKLRYHRTRYLFATVTQNIYRRLRRKWFRSWP